MQIIYEHMILFNIILKEFYLISKQFMFLIKQIKSEQ